MSYQYLLLFPSTVNHKTRKRVKTELFPGSWHIDFFVCMGRSFICVKVRIKQHETLKEVKDISFSLLSRTSTISISISVLWNWSSRMLKHCHSVQQDWIFIIVLIHVFHFPPAEMEMFAVLLYLNIKKVHDTVGSLICLLCELPCTSFIFFFPCWSPHCPPQPMLSYFHLFLNGISAFLSTIVTLTYCFFSLSLYHNNWLF